MPYTNTYACMHACATVTLLLVCMYMYVHTYARMHACAGVALLIVYMYRYVHVHVQVCKYVFGHSVSKCMCICTYACMYAYMCSFHLCGSTRMCVRVYVHIHTYIQGKAGTYTYTHIHIHTCIQRFIGLLHQSDPTGRICLSYI